MKLLHLHEILLQKRAKKMSNLLVLGDRISDIIFRLFTKVMAVGSPMDSANPKDFVLFSSAIFSIARKVSRRIRGIRSKYNITGI